MQRKQCIFILSILQGYVISMGTLQKKRDAISSNVTKAERPSDPRECTEVWKGDKWRQDVSITMRLTD
ncbi:hypothetical protein MXB_1855 [Myxobolus squamalis]|nr:hypothetical protein MXB_1855 [Myxobolus squamalis]